MSINYGLIYYLKEEYKMSLLLAAFMIGMTGKMIAEVGKDLTKIPARSQIQEDSKNGTFDVVKNFEQILYVCDVKRKSLGTSSVKVLPYTGYEKCLNYIREHHLTCKADEQRFITHYRKVLKKELSKRQEDFDKHYFKVKSEVESLMNSENYEIVRFEHLDVFVTQSDVEMKVNDICNKTFLGDFVVGEVKIKEISSGYKEIWALKIPVAMKFKLKDYYMACAERCGYIY